MSSFFVSRAPLGVRRRCLPSQAAKLTSSAAPPQSYKLPAGDSSLIPPAFASIAQNLGEIDILIANAGTCTHVLSHECTDEQFRETFETNTHFPYFLARAAYNSWFPAGTDDSVKKDKRIVFVSSISGLINNTPQQQCAYNASVSSPPSRPPLRTPFLD